MDFWYLGPFLADKGRLMKVICVLEKHRNVMQKPKEKKE